MRKFVTAVMLTLVCFGNVARATDTISMEWPLASEFQLHHLASQYPQIPTNIYIGAINEGDVVGVGVKVSVLVDDPSASIDAGSSEEDYWVRATLDYKIKYTDGSTAPPSEWHSTVPSSGWTEAGSALVQHFDKDNLTNSPEDEKFSVYGSVSIYPKFELADVDEGDHIANVICRLRLEKSTTSSTGPWSNGKTSDEFTIIVKYYESSGQ